VDQGALQTRAQPLEDIEARTRELGPTRQVKDIERLADLPVRLGFEIERRPLAPSMNLLIVLLPRPFGGAVMGGVGDIQGQRLELLDNRPPLALQ